MKLKIVMLTCAMSAAVLFAGCGADNTENSSTESSISSSEESVEADGEKEYSLSGSVEVDGRQGIAVDGDYYYVSGSTTLTKYDK